ncbi:glycoside hydrolase family protein [Pandoraea apista]|uniref:glycoside hydrolase family protein n=1 Tax=Pandoraea apista TaxID=93218 RepID=UPI000F65A793|nr:glycoside hydrolase family protein [Pandoraea apista]RRW87918.1 lysozyme [Pandoraea apista]RRW96279.1 lysozyme [Pandoraea apista]
MSNYDASALKAELTCDEGYRLRLYVDTVGKVSGGIGRNLTDKGLRPDEVDLMYANDISESEAWLDHNLPWWQSLDPVRQRVLMNMAFNMQGRLLEFRNFLAAVERHDWPVAKREMLDSRWAQEVGARATRLALMMETGV